MAEAPPDRSASGTSRQAPGSTARRREGICGDSQESRRRCGVQGRVGGIGEGRLDFQAAIQQVFGLALQVYSAWGRHDGEEGADYLLGELAVLRYIEDMRVVAAEQAAQVSGKTEGAADFDGLPVLVA
ncbi:hypothetical protein GQ600_22488 [Phytophthora cactorum]|nr:hypothetical protein GQ600_22488 [Phytophthora cactorum]